MLSFRAIGRFIRAGTACIVGAMALPHLAQVGFFQPILETVRHSGAPVGTLLKKTGLHRFDLEVGDNYVPQQPVLSLLDLVRKQEGVDDFVAYLGNRVHVAQLANWGSTLSHRSSLLSACRFAARYGHVVLTNERIKLEILGRKAKVSLIFLDPPTTDWSLFEYVNFAYMYSTFSMAAGADTAPDEVHFHSSRAPNLDRFLPPGNNTRVLLGQAATALVFPVEILAEAMLGPDSESAIERMFLERPPGAAESIAAILDSWEGEHTPNLAVVAEALGLSRRTLQRRITAEAKTFSEVVDQWRFTKSIEMISDPAMTIREVSERLHYANTANFDRAFRRWTGVSPSAYRSSI
ncbi:MAG: AraC family transcriptional regulator [Chromatiales bacterium]|nr:MAG: AraC family transcriptional regulator [Chromatiales bacterium]